MMCARSGVVNAFSIYVIFKLRVYQDNPEFQERYLNIP